MAAAASESSIAHTLLSGSFAGACSTMAGAPFDTVKVRLQTNSAGAVAGFLETVRKMVREERVTSFYRGATPALAAALIENTVVFGANSTIKTLYAQAQQWRNPSDGPANLQLSELAMIGGASGVFSATAICPAEVVKCRLQAQNTANVSPSIKYQGSLDCFRRILQSEGARGLFRGLPAQLARDVPFNFAFFGSYETICYMMCRGYRYESKDELRTLDLVLAGGLAGSAGWTVTIPMDTVKSKVQVSNCQNPSFAQVAETVRNISRSAGARGFFAGWSAAVLRAFPANGALFAGYELSDRFFRNRSCS